MSVLTRILLVASLLACSPYHTQAADLPRLTPDEAVSVLADVPLLTTEVDDTLRTLHPTLGAFPPQWQSPAQQKARLDTLITLLNYLDDYASANPSHTAQADYTARAAQAYVFASHAGIADAHEKATELLHQWHRLEPSSAQAHFIAGEYWMKHPDTRQEALQSLLHAQTLGHPKAGYLIAILWVGQNQPNKGIQTLRQHLKKHPEDAQAQTLLQELLWQPSGAPRKGSDADLMHQY